MWTIRIGSTTFFASDVTIDGRTITITYDSTVDFGTIPDGGGTVTNGLVTHHFEVKKANLGPFSGTVMGVLIGK